MIFSLALVLGHKLRLDMIKRLNLLFQGLILLLDALQFSFSFIGRLTRDDKTSRSCDRVVSWITTELCLECVALFLNEVVFSLQVIQLGVSLEEKLVFPLDLLDVTRNNAIMAVTFINESVQLVDLLLQLLAPELEEVHVVASFSGRFKSVFSSQGRAIVSITTGSRSESLTERVKKLIGLCLED